MPRSAGVAVKKSKDFSEDGIWLVTIGSKAYQIYRDTCSGWWRDAALICSKNYGDDFLGFTKDEAIDKLIEKYHS